MATVNVLINKDSKLTARTKYIGGATEIDILAGGYPVAFKRIGGNWNGEQAVREFRKSQKGWEDTGCLKLVQDLKLV